MRSRKPKAIGNFLSPFSAKPFIEALRPDIGWVGCQIDAANAAPLGFGLQECEECRACTLSACLSPDENLFGIENAFEIAAGA
jgi:hypothetical protein